MATSLKQRKRGSIQDLRSFFNDVLDKMEKTIWIKFLTFVFTITAVLFISWWVSYLISWLPAWNGNIDSVDKLKEVPLFNFFAALCRFIIALFFCIIYWMFARLFWSKRPVERDRCLFAHSGWGVVVYSFGAIILIVFVLMTVANIMCANTIFDDSAKLRSDYRGVFGIIKRSWDVICQFTDPGNIHDSTNLQGNIIALICALAGILCLSGLAVSALVSMIARRTQQWKQGLIHYTHSFRNYVVIIGVNEQTATIIKKSLKEPGIKYVLIQTRRNVESERAKLELKLEREEERKVVFYFGERTQYEDIYDLHVEHAKEVYILGENMDYENELDHDSFNMTCLELIAKYCKTIKDGSYKKNWENERIKCHVELEYQSTFTAFKSTHIYKNLNEGRVEFIPFNVHEIWAKKVLVDNFAVYPEGNLKKVQHYLPIDTYRVDGKDGQKITVNLTEAEQKCVHLIIIGMNQMGVALAVQAAQLVHLPNFVNNNNLRTTITFIDDNAVKESEFLMGRFSALFSLCRYRTIVCGKNSFNKDACTNEEDDFDIRWASQTDNTCGWQNSEYTGKYCHLGTNFMDIQWEFIEGNVATKDIGDYISALSMDTKHRTCTIAVCLNNPQQSLATALYLPEMVLKRAHQILVYQKNSFDLIDKIATSEKEWKRYEKLKPFGMIEGCYIDDAFDSCLAKLTYMVYSDKLSKGQPYKSKLKAEADRLWKEIGIDYRLSNINLVDSFSLKIRSAGNNWTEQKKTFRDENKLEALVLAEHNRWMTERLIMGYRPLTSEEWNGMRQKIAENPLFDYMSEKQRLKTKSRAHLDICSNDQLKERDPVTYNQRTDGKIVGMIPFLLNFAQRMCTNDILNNMKNVESPTSFVWDMKRVIVNDRDAVVIKKSKRGNEDRIEYLHTFWVGKYLITRKQWRMVMGELPPQLQGCPKSEDDKPITFVSKEMVDEFLIVCNHVTGLKFRLPWIEEWKCVKEHCDEDVKDLESKVWQWTQSQLFENCYQFCGKSQKFFDEKWNKDESYWLPNFKSSDLGFRLVLPYVFDRKFDDEFDDGVVVIDELLSEKNLVAVKGGVVELRDNDKVKYKVKVSDFRILRTPVTQRQWEAVMGAGNNRSLHKGDDYPVENVSYKQAKEFVKKLNDLKGCTVDLPTEAEWQMAAVQSKAGEKTIWHRGNSKSTHKVSTCSSKKAQVSDISDMCGNVWEWCLDYFADFSTFLDENKENEDKGGPAKGFVRVMRGGSWQFDKDWCTISSIMRSYWLPDYEAEDVGFRIAISEADYNELRSKSN